MKKIIIITLAIIAVFNISVNVVNATTTKNTDRTIAIKYCNKHYKNHKVKIVNENKVPKYRKSKKVVYIERVKTVSKGRYGITKGNYKIRYNKPLPKNKRYIVYLIYNPTTNYTDDIIAVVSNNKIR